MYRDYDAAVVRWISRCVERGSHRFNASGICMECGAERRGPTVVVRGGVPRREKKK